MSDKKRTTVTTIETHEVWIIRKAVPELSDDAAAIMPVETAQPRVVPASAEGDNRPNRRAYESTDSILKGGKT